MAVASRGENPGKQAVQAPSPLTVRHPVTVIQTYDVGFNCCPTLHALHPVEVPAPILQENPYSEPSESLDLVARKAVTVYPV